MQNTEVSCCLKDSKETDVSGRKRGQGRETQKPARVVIHKSM